ncbi:hypothetical protein BUALT_BualtUnG0009500 [Buddleja alternifolia]|uniref:Uncharacterized protein n=1 Tax=Buddleja alternifolia TaxID=168488 RepID=A0AAV6W0P3_9LAMI|nr:hypothetical protein BUALT_BualtUnG0008400 [Buddleja alternifolia]KAG8363059.1 hypothetical protein BUALT_BualtUnG0009500 [Buddleja alternifolia]
MVPTLGTARRVGCYCGLVWASSRQGNERAVPMGGLSERCAARLFARDDGIPWAWGAQASGAKMVPTLGTARRVGFLLRACVGIIEARKRASRSDGWLERAMCRKAICSRRWHPVGVGSSSFQSQNGAGTRHRETGRLLLRACVGIIEARKGASRSDGWLERAMCLLAICLRRWHPVGVGSSIFDSAKMVPALGIARWVGRYCGIVWRRHTMQASSFFGSSACLPRSASVFLVLNTHNGGTRLAKTSHFRLVLRPSGPRRGVDLKAFAVSHVPCKCLRTSSGCWLMSSCSISRMRNNERVRGPRPLFAPKTSVRRFVRTTVVLVLTGSSWLGSCETGVGEECYLVDPASSHMLVSKIKPCMYKRSTRALPVAAMIHDNSTDRTALVPATHHSNFCPINFRCWTLGWAGRSASGVHRSSRPFCRRCAPGLNWPGRASGAVTLKKLECSKQAYALYTLAWDNIIGFRRTTAKAFAKDVFINQERKLGARRRSDTVLVSTINDADQGSADVAYRTPPAPYEKSKSLGSGGSMVARLKLKGIDGRAPPGVEPAA